jgi:hypothetical protein
MEEFQHKKNYTRYWWILGAIAIGLFKGFSKGCIREHYTNEAMHNYQNSY